MVTSSSSRFPSALTILERYLNNGCFVQCLQTGFALINSFERLAMTRLLNCFDVDEATGVPVITNSQLSEVEFNIVKLLEFINPARKRAAETLCGSMTQQNAEGLTQPMHELELTYAILSSKHKFARRKYERRATAEEMAQEGRQTVRARAQQALHTAVAKASAPPQGDPRLESPTAR